MNTPRLFRCRRDPKRPRVVLFAKARAFRRVRVRVGTSITAVKGRTPLRGGHMPLTSVLRCCPLRKTVEVVSGVCLVAMTHLIAKRSQRSRITIRTISVADSKRQTRVTMLSKALYGALKCCGSLDHEKFPSATS